MAKPPVRWGTTEPEIKWSTDHLGEHTEDLLYEYGFTNEGIENLKARCYRRYIRRLSYESSSADSISHVVLL